MLKQHTAVGQQTGETAHVERWKNTLRQHLARFMHMTLSFSRVRGNARGLPASLLHRYNLNPGCPSQVSHYPSVVVSGERVFSACLHKVLLNF